MWECEVRAVGHRQKINIGIRNLLTKRIEGVEFLDELHRMAFTLSDEASK